MDIIPYQQILPTVSSQLSKTLEAEAKALPLGFNSERFKKETLTVLNSMGKDIANINTKDKIFKLVRNIMWGGYLGLSFANKECYIILYSGDPEFMTDYKGEKKLCYNYSVRPIKNIYADIVREGDVFKPCIKDNKTMINFMPVPFSTKKVIGAFAVVEYEDGSVNYEMLNMDDLEAIRKCSKTKKPGGPWDKFTNEMYKKSAIRRLTKNIQLNFSTQQREAWDNGSQMDFSPSVDETKNKVKNDIQEMQQEEEIIEPDFTDTPYEEV